MQKSIWEQYIINNSYYNNSNNFMNLSINGDILTLTSKNSNYGDWRGYIGNDFVKKWN